jgi:hypothetical protein
VADEWQTSGRQVADEWQTSGRQVAEGLQMGYRRATAADESQTIYRWELHTGATDKLQTSYRQVADEWQTSGRQVADKWQKGYRWATDGQKKIMITTKNKKQKIKKYVKPILNCLTIRAKLKKLKLWTDG